MAASRSWHRRSETFITGLGSAILCSALLLAGGCTDEPTPPLDPRDDHGVGQVSTFEALLTCTVDVSAGGLECGSYPPGGSSPTDGPRLNLIIGSQHQFVRLANDTPSVKEDYWGVDVTVQNLSLQPFATADGSTPHPDGVRVFFVEEPSNGVEVVNHSGTANFLGTDPAKYYAYSEVELGADWILSPGEVSAAKWWEFALNGATEFVFSVLISTTVPAPAPEAYGVHLTRVVAGDAHACGETPDGEVYCWGRNTHGQLGDGTSIHRWTPDRVEAPKGIQLSRIALNSRHTCAEGSDGEVYCWGDNASGQLGDGTRAIHRTPVRVRAPEGIKLSRLAAGGDHTCAEGSDGHVYCWGHNVYGQLGNGTDTISTTPIRAHSPTGVWLSRPVAGWQHTCAHGSDGNAYCWGYNNSAQLGDGTYLDRDTPVQVQSPAGVTFSELTAGSLHNCAMGSDGAAYCWGYNGWGQIGNGEVNPASPPVKVKAPEGVEFSGLEAGATHTCAEGSDGNAYCWGDGRDGRLGNGSEDRQPTPVEVSLPPGVTLSGLTALTYTCAYGSNGRTYCWGRNDYGGLGDGTYTDRDVPTPVAGTRRP